MPTTYRPATAVAKWSRITTDTLPGRITSEPLLGSIESSDQVGHRQQGGYSSRHLKPVTPPCSPPPHVPSDHSDYLPSESSAVVFSSSPRARRQSTCRIKLRNILRPATCLAVSTTTSRQNQVSGPSPANYEPGGHNYEPPESSPIVVFPGPPRARRPPRQCGTLIKPRRRLQPTSCPAATKIIRRSPPVPQPSLARHLFGGHSDNPLSNPHIYPCAHNPVSTAHTANR